MDWQMRVEEVPADLVALATSKRKELVEKVSEVRRASYHSSSS
jgi:hypothetical protein